MGLFGAASTGTAISSLGGVAATNATLAWFGGGSLAAGGLGMAGGAWVIGGLVAAPVLAVFTTFLASSAESKKYQAMSYYESVKALSEAMKGEKLLWLKIYDETKEILATLKELEPSFNEKIAVVNYFANKKGIEVAKWEQDAQNELTALMQLAKTLQTAINEPIMSDDDEITQGVIKLQKESTKLMEKIKAEFSE